MLSFCMQAHVRVCVKWGQVVAAGGTRRFWSRRVIDVLSSFSSSGQGGGNWRAWEQWRPCEESLVSFSLQTLPACPSGSRSPSAVGVAPACPPHWGIVAGFLRDSCQFRARGIVAGFLRLCRRSASALASGFGAFRRVQSRRITWLYFGTFIGVV